MKTKKASAGIIPKSINNLWLLPVVLSALLASCGGGRHASSGSGPPQATNHAPVASAGADQTVYAGTHSASLDGSQSSDPDNDAITFSWSIISGPAGGATLTNETTAHPSVTATTPGVYKVQLIVSDGKLSSAAADVTVMFAEGVLLAGDSAALAKNVMVDMLPVGVSPDQVQDGIILTRLDVFLDPTATVAQLNAALTSVQGSIVTMLHNMPVVTVAIPQPADVDALAAVAAALNAKPGVLLASIARVAGSKKLPPSPAGDQINQNQLAQLLPARFPAAWNASLLATNGFNDESPCAGRKVSVLIADNFKGVLIGADEVQLGTETNAFPIFGTPAPAKDDKHPLHGFEVAATLAAHFDSANPTGANPFTDCLDINGVQLSALGLYDEMVRIEKNFPDGKFLLNYSRGYDDNLPCLNLATGCTAALVNGALYTAVERAYHSVTWKALTASRWDDFLAGVAAGNEKDLPGTIIYPGLGVSVADSFMSVATITDPLLTGFLSDSSLWDPQLQPGGFPSLLPAAAQVTAFKLYAQGAGADQIGSAGNVLMVGATTAGFTSLEVAEDTYSDSDPDLFAVGSGPAGGGIFMPTEVVNGTSFAAPQVTGLASYLWLLSSAAKVHIPTFNDLNALPSSVTRQAIFANTRPGTGVNIIDAYATILSMDAAQLPTPTSAPIRLAILDLNNDGRFDDGDVAGFLGIFLDSSGKAREPTDPDYSRFDLNGDGYSGGSRTEQFDLDRVGSTQYGTTHYDSIVTQQIEGNTISFDETQLTDLNILCYYAYSPLYTGSTAARTTLLGSNCGTNPAIFTESSIELDVSGVDATSGTALFPDVSQTVSTQGDVPPSPQPFDFTIQKSYRPDQTLPPMNYKVVGHSDGPIVAKSNTQPSEGAYNEEVSCSITGNATHDENDNAVFPKPITLNSSAAGNFEPETSENPAIYSVSFTMQRGEVVSGAPLQFGNSDLIGHVSIQYSLHGEDEPEMDFALNDGTESDPTPAVVTNGIVVAIEKGGFFQVNWSISVTCLTEHDKDNPEVIASKRAGTLSVSYAMTH